MLQLKKNKDKNEIKNQVTINYYYALPKLLV
jgi:hypothetical protein